MKNEQLRVLVVDDDAVVLERLRTIVHREGYAVETSMNGEDALERITTTSFDAVVMDVQLPGMSGLDVLTKAFARTPELPIILVTAFGSLEGAIDAIRNKAFDYLVKPVAPSDLRLALKRATRLGQLEGENRRLKEIVEREHTIPGLIAKSPCMQEIVSLIGRLRQNESHVFIRGESGTGKDVIARALHLESVRADGPFVTLNCAAVPESLLESELFGHVKGAFSGAHQAKRGLFARANGGTLFLDEIGEMQPSLQSKLLRIVQDQEVRPVGSTESIQTDVRIIAATNRRLEESIARGDFREDLYYRLNVIPIRLESLRNRVEDIAALAHAFVQRFDPERRLGADAILALERHSWPGNVRELENVIERSLALSSVEELRAADLLIERSVQDIAEVVADTSAGQAAVAPSLIAGAVEQQLSLKELEALYIDEILTRTGGNKTEAARILGINRATLYRRKE